jgi:hypothetical protein
MLYALPNEHFVTLLIRIREVPASYPVTDCHDFTFLVVYICHSWWTPLQIVEEHHDRFSVLSCTGLLLRE